MLARLDPMVLIIYIRRVAQLCRTTADVFTSITRANEITKNMVFTAIHFQVIERVSRDVVHIPRYNLNKVEAGL